MKRLQQILGRKHQRNLHVRILFMFNLYQIHPNMFTLLTMFNCKQAIYILHPSLGLRTAVLAMQMFVDGEVPPSLDDSDFSSPSFRCAA